MRCSVLLAHFNLNKMPQEASVFFILYRGFLDKSEILTPEFRASFIPLPLELGEMRFFHITIFFIFIFFIKGQER